MIFITALRHSRIPLHLHYTIIIFLHGCTLYTVVTNDNSCFIVHISDYIVVNLYVCVCVCASLFEVYLFAVPVA